MKGSWFILQAKVISVQGQSKWLETGPTFVSHIVSHAHLKYWLYKVFMSLLTLIWKTGFTRSLWIYQAAAATTTIVVHTDLKHWLYKVFIYLLGETSIWKRPLCRISGVWHFLSISLDLDYNHMFCPYL